MDYFPNIPLIAYPDLTSNTKSNFVTMTNILTISSFLKEVIQNSSLFYEYEIKEGETPELIADKLYGDPKRFWIVLLFNKLNNPLYDFPLSISEVESLIESKYDISIPTSQSTIHHYEEKVTKIIKFNDFEQSRTEDIVEISALQQNKNTGISEIREFLPGTADTSLDAGSYTSTFGQGFTVEVIKINTAISVYTYEMDMNEKKRKIKLLDKSYVGPVENEFKRLMSNGI